MWKLEREGYYFKIFDDRKTIAGYFAPEYGEIYPEEKASEVIEEMYKKHEKIKGGYLVLPMVKFGIFNEEREIDLEYLTQQLDNSKNRIHSWQEFLSSKAIARHKIDVSHTDHDMLSITFEIVFSNPVSLEKTTLQDELGKTLDSIQEAGLL